MRIVTLLALCALLCCFEGHKQEECLNKNIPLPMIKEMINISQPKDNKPHRQILGKLKKKCFRKLTVTDFKRILEIYDKHVLEKMWKNNTTSPLLNTFMVSFKRLRNAVEICETSGKQTLSPCPRENLKSLEKNFDMLKPEDHIKALSEFRTVLVWISLAMDRRLRTRRFTSSPDRRNSGGSRKQTYLMATHPSRNIVQ